MFIVSVFEVVPAAIEKPVVFGVKVNPATVAEFATQSFPCGVKTYPAVVQPVRPEMSVAACVAVAAVGAAEVLK